MMVGCVVHGGHSMCGEQIMCGLCCLFSGCGVCCVTNVVCMVSGEGVCGEGVCGEW